MPLYEVSIKAWCTVAVQAESEDQAMDIASGDVSYGDFQMQEAGPAKLVPENQRDSLMQHADKVLL